jgi:hypothetical protein
LAREARSAGAHRAQLTHSGQRTHSAPTTSAPRCLVGRSSRRRPRTWSCAGGAPCRRLPQCVLKILALLVHRLSCAGSAEALGLFLFAKHALPLMAARGGGVLGVTGATASWRGVAVTLPFAQAKFAKRALAQSLARDYGPRSVHVFHVVVDGPVKRTLPYPGMVETYALAHRARSCAAHGGRSTQKQSASGCPMSPGSASSSRPPWRRPISTWPASLPVRKASPAA